MNLKNNEPCPACRRYKNRGLTVDAVIVKDRKILLIKRGGEPYKGFWGNAGGYVDHDETAEDAVKRETLEETGLVAKSVRFIGLYTDPARHPDQAVSAAYSVEVEGEPKAGDDAAECEWFDVDDLPKKLAFDHDKIIEDYLKNIK